MCKLVTGVEFEASQNFFSFIGSANVNLWREFGKIMKEFRV
jgi:hypothetical protein